MSRLIDFYDGKIPSDDGDTIDQIIEWDRDRWEASHLSIQWVFPTKKPSQFNPEAPTLDDATIEEFMSDADRMIKFHFAFQSWLKAYGINFESVGPGQPPKLEWQETENAKEWLEEFNHNHLRVTRILECLRFFGFGLYAITLFHHLTDHAKITPNTYKFWREATYG
jgi:hypothetical protein